MLNVDRGADGDLVALAKRLEGVEGGGLHQADHVGSGIDGRKFGMVRGESVLELDGFAGFAAGADGDGFGHFCR